MRIRTRHVGSFLVTALAVVAFAGCGGQASGGSAASDVTPTTTGALVPAAAPVEPEVTKLLVFVVENHSYSQMRSGMPWVARLAEKYGYATRYRGVTHPSLPNYLAIAGGNTFGVDDDDPPADHPLSGASVFGKAIAAGSTAATYAEGMTSQCQLTNTGRYAVKHNPWAYFADERSDCQDHDGPLSNLAGDIADGDLPAVGLVIPDMCNDGHDCSLRTTNAWMRREVGAVIDGPDFADGQLAVVITADEDDYRHGNKVLTVVAHPALDHAVVRTRLNHYGLSRSYADVGGFAPLRKAADARSLLDAFGLTT
jgi:acid phosphatase